MNRLLLVGFCVACASVLLRGPAFGQCELQELLGSGATTGDRFGGALAVDGNTLVVGAKLQGTTGAAYVFEFNGTSWVETATLTAALGMAGDLFGHSVAIDADRIAVTALGENGGQGAAYVFEKPAGGWAGTLTESAKLIDPDVSIGDRFGLAIAVSGDSVAVGSPFQDGAGADAKADPLDDLDGRAVDVKSDPQIANTKHFAFSQSVVP